MMPAFLQQMSNPAVQDMSTNPNVLSALDQIQRGLEALRTNMPNIGGSLGGQSFFPTPNANTTANADSTVPNDIPTTEGGQDNNFAELMRRMVNFVLIKYSFNFTYLCLYFRSIEYLYSYPLCFISILSLLNFLVTNIITVLITVPIQYVLVYAVPSKSIIF